MGEQRLPGEGRGDEGRSRRQQKHRPAAIGQPDEEAEARQDADQAHGSEFLQQPVDVEGGASAEILGMVAQERVGRGAPSSRSMVRKSQPALSFDE